LEVLLGFKNLSLVEKGSQNVQLLIKEKEEVVEFSYEEDCLIGKNL
jgi:hypothetical protein